jgi:hypothetical protein
MEADQIASGLGSLVTGDGALDRSEVYRAVRAAAAQARTAPAPDVLWAVAAAIASRGAVGDESALTIHARTAVRLLERGAAAAAWGVAVHAVTRQPLRTAMDGDRVYAWLSGFRDPRVGVGDDAYDISDRIVLRTGVEEVFDAGTGVVVAGWAHLAHLVAGESEKVAVVLRRGDGEELRTPATRVRRPDRVKPRGAELTRLAWSGFRAEVPVEPLLAGAGRWHLEIEIAAEGVVRRAAGTRAQGGIVDRAQPYAVSRQAGRILLVRAGPRGRLTLEVLPAWSAVRRSLAAVRRQVWRAASLRRRVTS